MSISDPSGPLVATSKFWKSTISFPSLITAISADQMAAAGRPDKVLLDRCRFYIDDRVHGRIELIEP